MRVISGIVLRQICVKILIVYHAYLMELSITVLPLWYLKFVLVILIIFPDLLNEIICFTISVSGRHNWTAVRLDKDNGQLMIQLYV